MDITSSKSFVTRSVRDFAGLLDAIGGPDLSETLVAPVEARPYAEELGRDPGRLRIGLMRQLAGNVAKLDAEALKAVEHSAALLTRLGHHVEEAAPETFTTMESFEIIGTYWPLKVTMRATAAERILGRSLGPSDLEPGTYAMLDYARKHSLMDFAGSLQKIASFTRRLLAWWTHCDLLLTPATGTPPTKLGAFDAADGRMAMMRFASMAMLANITGQPAASVPLYWTPEGLPIGTQLVANIGREDLLLRVSSQLEQAQPWASRLPTVSARGIS